MTMPFTSPTGYGLGRGGWVTSAFEPGDDPPVDILCDWIEESYRAVAPKKLVAELDSRGRVRLTHPEPFVSTLATAECTDADTNAGERRRSAAAARRMATNQSKRASTNSSGSKGTRSPMASPRPTSLTGMPSPGLDREDDATLGRAVQLGEHHPGDVGGLA